MDAALVQRVWLRAGHRCEYCQIPQDCDEIPFEIDHIIAIKHRGLTIAGNLALACFHDNSHKGSNIAGLDPKTRKLTPLFNPRRHEWARHFRWRGACQIGRTAVGRVTVAILNINDPLRIELRETLIQEGLFPPA
jgi:5-methylcytosine-specific restriction endonuclease McrA